MGISVLGGSAASGGGGDLGGTVVAGAVLTSVNGKFQGPFEPGNYIIAVDSVDAGTKVATYTGNATSESISAASAGSFSAAFSLSETIDGFVVGPINTSTRAVLTKYEIGDPGGIATVPDAVALNVNGGWASYGAGFTWYTVQGAASRDIKTSDIICLSSYSSNNVQRYTRPSDGATVVGGIGGVNDIFLATDNYMLRFQYNSKTVYQMPYATVGSWTGVSVNTAPNFPSASSGTEPCAWGNGLGVLFTGSTVWVSTNEVTWEQYTANISLQSIMFDGEKLIASSNGNFYTTSDGYNWTSIGDPSPGANWRRLIQLNGEYLLFNTTQTNTNTYYASSDLTNWTTRTLPVAGNWAFASVTPTKSTKQAGVVMIGGYNYYNYLSNDGVNWYQGAGYSNRSYFNIIDSDNAYQFPWGGSTFYFSQSTSKKEVLF